MKIASLADVKAKLSAYVNDAETNGPIVITRNGKAVAMLLAPIDDEDLERLLLAASPKFQSLMKAARDRFAAGKGISEKEFWKRVNSDRPNPTRKKSPNAK